MAINIDSNTWLNIQNKFRVNHLEFAKVKLTLKFRLHTFPGCAAYAEGCAAYAEGCAAYAEGCAAYAEGCAAYVRNCENKANSVQLSWSWD